MSLAAEFEAALPEPHSILGLRLLPLSLGRYRLLKRFNCPFVDDENKDITLDNLVSELFFALLVCGFPVLEFRWLLDHPKKLAKEAKRFGRVAQKIIRRDKHFNVLEHYKAFKTYLESSSSAPWIVLSSQDNTEQSMSHWSTSMQVTLMSKVGWTEEMIDERPLNQAIEHFLKYAESEGQVKLYDPSTWQDLQVDAKKNGEALAKIMEAMNHAA